MIGIPEAFARSTVEREGEPGAVWLANLPRIVDELLGRWGCVPDGEVMHGGVGVIVPVRRRAEGTAALKVSFPHPGNVHEPDAFAAWGGRGAVLLHERDDERFAMLLERVQTSTLAEGEDGDEVAAVAGRINRRLAIPAPPGLPRLREQANAWEEQLRKDSGELTHTLSRYVVDAAVATIRELGRVQPDTVIHGDLHARNILRADREPWLAVDPKGYAGDPAYDGGTLLKARALTLLEADDLRKAVHRTLDVFAEAAELDRERSQRWAQLHVVQAAFWGRRPWIPYCPQRITIGLAHRIRGPPGGVAHGTLVDRDLPGGGAEQLGRNDSGTAPRCGGRPGFVAPPEEAKPCSDAMKERGLRSSWAPGGCWGCSRFHDEGGP